MGKKDKQDAWYVNLIMGFVILLTTFFINRSYYGYLSPNRELPSGKGGKLGLLVIKHLDNIGGKPLVFGSMIFLALLCFWWAYQKYQKDRK
jgi:hypothetical protein